MSPITSVARVFFVWIRVLNLLFVPSVFWSLMLEIFVREQSKRLFGFLAAGTAPAACSGRSSRRRFVKSSAINLLLFLGAAMFLVASSLFALAAALWRASRP